jgi:hypothetical protein
MVLATNECALSVGHPQVRYRQGSENVTCTSKDLMNQLRSIDYQSETVYVLYFRQCGRLILRNLEMALVASSTTGPHCCPTSVR